MIINPIIPIWIMFIICIILIILVLYNKNLKDKISNKQNNEITNRQKNLIKNHIRNSFIKICIIILLFIINLRFMIPNGESTILNSDFNILFVIDTSVSMKALDYNGNKERLEGVINDCCYIVDELSNCKFSIITFGDTVQKIIPFTNDTDIVQAQLKTISLEDDDYAKGTSINLVKETFEETLKKEKNKQENAKYIVFFITDGEITIEGEKLESFSSIKQYISNGAVMGYGTTSGGKMINSDYADNPSHRYYYKFYYDEKYNVITAISKIDEENLKKIASDLGMDYIQMSKTSNINYKISDIKQQISKSQTTEEKISSYQDIYYYFAIPLVILLIADFTIKKRRM